jgi:tRNA 2-selenouridine synthase
MKRRILLLPVQKISISELLQNQDDYVIVDVRTSREFLEDHIPGAISMPILTDEEHHEVGTIFKQVSHETAKEKGLVYAAPKLLDFYRYAREVVKSGKKICFQCFRGGMRSHSIANVVTMMNLPATVLEGGYKGFRQEVNRFFESPMPFQLLVLHGYTGVGKSLALEQLEEKNEPIIHLERLAKNSGSVYGNVFYDDQTITQKNFESMLYAQIQTNLKQGKDYAWIESEGKRVGKAVLPPVFYQANEKGIHIRLQTSRAQRIQNLYRDYSTGGRLDVLNTATNRLRKRLGHERCNKILAAIEADNLDLAIEELLIHYYDPLYEHTLDWPYTTTISYENPEDLSTLLVEWKNAPKEKK